MQTIALRQAIFIAGQSLDDDRALQSCGDLLWQGGLEEPARTLYLVVALRAGASPRGLARQGEVEWRIGFAAAPDVPDVSTVPAAPFDAAVADLRALMPLDGGLTPLAGLQGEAADQAFVAAHDFKTAQPLSPADLTDRLRRLLDGLRGPFGSSDTELGLEALLEELREGLLAEGSLETGDSSLGLADLAGRLGRNAARRWLLDMYDLAFAPFGSAALLHRTAHLSDEGLGPFARGAGLLLRSGEDLRGLLQLAHDQPLEVGPERPDLSRLAWLLARATSGRLRVDLADALADEGLLLALWSLAAPALREPEVEPDRELLQHIRDGGMDLGDLQLAWRLQALIAVHWAEDKNEQLALGDLCAFRGDHAAAERAFGRALQLDPGNEHGRNCLQALQEGDHGRFVNQGGFGTPDERKRLRREGRPRPERFAEAARALDLLAAGVDLAIELAPDYSGAGSRSLQDGSHLRQLGRRRERSPWGELTTLRGVEAIRGFHLGETPLLEAEALLGGQWLGRCTPKSHTVTGGRRKSVFNLWVDVSRTPAGRYELELRLTDLDRRVHLHRETVQVGAPMLEAERPGSDAVVDPPSVDTRGELDTAINSRPSLVRPARRALLDPAPQNVLVLRPDQLGDLVCSIPALKRLREILPAARLTLLASPSNAALARTLALFDEVMVTDFRTDPAAGRRTMTLRRQRELRAELHARGFDLAIDLADNSPSRYLLTLSGARSLFGMSGDHYGFLDQGFQLRTRDPANGSEEIAASAKALAMVEALGIALRSHGETLRRTDLSPALLRTHGVTPGRYAVLHAGARLPFSRWPHYPALAALILDRTDWDVVIIGDNALPPDSLSPRLVGEPRFHLIEHSPPFDELDALVSYCGLFVGNDSGPKHLASLRGVEVVSLHCARNNWSEWGQENRGVIMSRRVPCAGCQIEQHPEECGREIACLRLISPEEVFAAALPLLKDA